MIIIFGCDEYYPSGGANDIIGVVLDLVDPTNIDNGSTYSYDFYHAVRVTNGFGVEWYNWNDETKVWEFVKHIKTGDTI